jgi:hypothetical protein
MQQKVVRELSRGRQVFISSGHSREAQIIRHAPVCRGANRMRRSNYCNNRVNRTTNRRGKSVAAMVAKFPLSDNTGLITFGIQGAAAFERRSKHHGG